MKFLEATETLQQVASVLQSNLLVVMKELKAETAARQQKWAENLTVWNGILPRVTEALARLSAEPEVARLVCEKGDLATFLQPETFPSELRVNFPEDTAELSEPRPAAAAASPASGECSQELAVPTKRLVQL
jgi:hypothetical protein